jgi:hypothetical protein
MENKIQKQKIQLILNNKQAIDLYQVFKHGTRTLMVEQAIILLAQDEVMRNLFLDEYDKMKVDNILASARTIENSSKNKTEKKENNVVEKKESSDKKEVDIQSSVSVGW